MLLPPTFLFSTDPALTEIYTLSLHDALPILFAFALWDAAERRLLLARDRFGKKPLYYFHDGRRLVFASTLTALLEHPLVRSEEHTSELQSQSNLVCRLLLEKKKYKL